MSNYSQIGTSNQSVPVARYAAMGQPPNVSAVEIPITPQIPVAHDNLEKSLSFLHEVIGNLESRMKSALRIEPASPTPNPSNSIAPPTTIYDKLNASTDSVGCAISRIQEILRLLEL